MDKVSFFTAVDYGTLPKTFFQWALEKVDNYFYFGGKKARVLSGELKGISQGVQIVEDTCSMLSTCLKVASFFIAFIPLLAVKALLRACQPFHIVALPPMTDLQNTVASKLSKASQDTVKKVLETLISSFQMSPEKFVEVHVTPSLGKLQKEDERTQEFFQRMMVPILQDVAAVPSLSFTMLEIATGDKQIQRKLVEAVALPIIQDLIKELDCLKSSIVDDINSG